MNGIVGQINKRESLKEMLDMISHRGENQKFYNDDFIGLAKCSEDKKEIYENSNYIILFSGNISHKSKSNEDYILNLYKKYKEDAFNKIKGSFSLCIYNKKDQSIILAKDKFGRVPLYYTKENFSFATEIKCLLNNGTYQKVINKSVIKDYFLYQTNPNDETIFKGIFKVPSGSYIKYQNGKIKTIKYYTFAFKNLIYDEAELNELLIAAIKNNFKYYEGAASFLSSGIDSSLIVSNAKVKDTYTVAYDDSEYSESYHTTSLCNLLNINNHIININKEEFIKEIENIQGMLDEPCMDPAVVALFFGAKEVGKDYKFVFSGEGADELFGGYNRYLDVVKYQNYKMVPKIIKNIIFKVCYHLPEIKGVNFLLRRFGNIKEQYAGVAKIFNEQSLNKLLKIKTKKQINKYNEVMKNEYDELEKMQIVDINYWLNAEINATERICAYNSLQVIMPFLSDDMVEIASMVPSSFKVQSNITKQILRNAAKEFIPNDAYQNKKLGFPVPLRKWIKTNEYYEEFLNKLSQSVVKQFFNQKRLIKMLNKTFSGKKDYSKQLFSIYCFLVWYEKYFV